MMSRSEITAALDVEYNKVSRIDANLEFLAQGKPDDYTDEDFACLVYALEKSKQNCEHNIKQLKSKRYELYRH